MYLLAPFILQNFKKILRADPELWGCAIFGPKMAHLSWTKVFGTNHYYYFHLLIGPFSLCKILKNYCSRSRVMKMRYFWAQNFPFAPYIYIYFWKIIKIILICLLAPFDDDRSGRGRDSFRMSQRDIGENCYMTG